MPPSSFVTGSGVVKDNLMLGHVLTDLTAPGAPVLLSDIGDMITAHSARETVVFEGEDGRKIEKDKRKGPAQGLK